MFNSFNVFAINRQCKNAKKVRPQRIVTFAMTNRRLPSDSSKLSAVSSWPRERNKSATCQLVTIGHVSSLHLRVPTCSNITVTLTQQLRCCFGTRKQPRTTSADVSFPIRVFT